MGSICERRQILANLAHLTNGRPPMSATRTSGQTSKAASAGQLGRVPWPALVQGRPSQQSVAPPVMPRAQAPTRKLLPHLEARTMERQLAAALIVVVVVVSVTDASCRNSALSATSSASCSELANARRAPWPTRVAPVSRVSSRWTLPAATWSSARGGANSTRWICSRPTTAASAGCCWPRASKATGRAPPCARPKRASSTKRRRPPGVTPSARPHLVASSRREISGPRARRRVRIEAEVARWRAVVGAAAVAAEAVAAPLETVLAAPTQAGAPVAAPRPRAAATAAQ